MPAPSLPLRFEAPTFEPLFVKSLTRYVTHKCRECRVRREDVFDVVQEAFTTILANVRMFRPEKGDFDTWARGVARNVIRRHLRRAKQYGDHFSEYPNVHDYPSPESSPERCAQLKQARISIATAMGTLTAQQTSVVISFDIDDMSHIEIANDLHITAAASHVCHLRAHIRLAGCLDRDLLSVMPPSRTSCNQPSSDEPGSRWTERSHYALQLATAIMAVFLSFALNSSTTKGESTTGDARGLAPLHNNPMYRLDEHAVHRDAPRVKPEPASLLSIRAVPTPTTVGDKPSFGRPSTWLPPHKHVEQPSANRPHVW